MAHFHYLILIIVIDERLVLVIIPEEMVKWTMDEFGVPQKETTLFTSLSDVETAHPKVRAKNKESKIKTIK